MIEALGPLTAGDRVALIATASPAPADAVSDAVALLESWGLEVVSYPSVSGAHDWASYLAAPDAVRAADLQAAWCDPSIAGIFAARGGYGTMRLLDRLDVAAMRAATPKPLYGSSDLTALHSWLADELGVASWFTPMVATSGVRGDEVATERLREAVFEPWQGREFRPTDAESLVGGVASGKLVGGNLALLAAGLGASRGRPIDNGGAIVLLEDVDEQTYKYDGYLTSLLRAGWFDGVAGIALGSWAHSNEAEVRSLVTELLVPLGVPLVWNLGFGHCEAAISLPLGVQARLDAGERPGLVLG